MSSESTALGDTDTQDNSLKLFSDESIENLTDGFLEILQPEVTRVEKSLEELM